MILQTDNIVLPFILAAFYVQRTTKVYLIWTQKVNVCILKWIILRMYNKLKQELDKNKRTYKSPGLLFVSIRGPNITKHNKIVEKSFPSYFKIHSICILSKLMLTSLQVINKDTLLSHSFSHLDCFTLFLVTEIFKTP